MEPDNQSIIGNIKKVAPKYCDNCGHRYSPLDFKVLKSSNEGALIHLNCPSCANTYVINAFSSNAGIGAQRVPIVLDIEELKELEKFANMGPVSKNDAIDFHNFVKSFNSITKFFQGGNPNLSATK